MCGKENYLVIFIIRNLLIKPLNDLYLNVLLHNQNNIESYGEGCKTHLKTRPDTIAISFG